MSTSDHPPRRIVFAVVASTFFVGFGGGVVFPILPNLGEVLGISAFMVGLILSANRFTRLVCNAPAGVLVDRIGTRKPFIAGLVIEAFATVLYVVAMLSALPEAWFMLARILWGVGSALVFATAYTITADVSDAGSRGTSMGIIRAGITFGFPAGLVLGGVVSDLWGDIEAFVLAAAFAAFASLIAYLIVPETHVDEPDDSIKPWDVDTSLPAVTIGLVNFGLYFAYIGVLFSTLVLFLDERAISIFGLDAQGSSGMLMAITVLMGATFTLGGGVLSDSLGARIPVLVGFLLTACLGFVVLAIGSSFEVLVLACILIGAGQGGIGGPLIALLADLTPEERMGRAVGTNNVLGDIGGGLGPLVSLPLVNIVGFEPVYAVSALLPLVAGVILLVGVYSLTGQLNPTIRETSN
ncbi:MFS transporter [Halovivax gelatinilyticus]|uniref:MFS transporter n=1 Tax=Halovivax gelatinilyticus TaxID=2961597 RepID=UPI0020CA5D46|nr:MFS transporter [Halovivax gelatinilyticus]